MEQKPILKSRKFLMTIIVLALVTAVAVGYAFIDPTAIGSIFTTYVTGVIASLSTFLGVQGAVDHRAVKNHDVKPNTPISLPIEESFHEPTTFREIEPPPRIPPRSPPPLRRP